MRVCQTISQLSVLLMTGLFYANSVSAFECTYNGDIEGTSVAWFERDVVMQVSDVDGFEISSTDLYGISQASAQSWTNVGCSDAQVRIGETVDDVLVGFNWIAGIGAAENKNIIVFRRGEDGTVDDWLRSSSEYAITSVTWIKSNGRIVDTDIEINNVNTAYDHCEVFNEDNFSCEPGTADLQSILTHEIGHVLGLDHPMDIAQVDATMWASAGTNEVKKRTLEVDDLEGLCFLYPGGVDALGQCQEGAERIEPADFKLTRKLDGCSQGLTSSHLAFGICALMAIRIRRRRTDA